MQTEEGERRPQTGKSRLSEEDMETADEATELLGQGKRRPGRGRAAWGWGALWFGVHTAVWRALTVPAHDPGQAQRCQVTS